MRKDQKPTAYSQEQARESHARCPQMQERISHSRDPIRPLSPETEVGQTGLGLEKTLWHGHTKGPLSSFLRFNDLLRVLGDRRCWWPPVQRLCTPRALCWTPAPQLESHVTEARFFGASQMCTLTVLAQRNLSHIKLGPFAISPHRVGWLVLVLNLANLGRQNLI